VVTLPSNTSTLPCNSSIVPNSEPGSFIFRSPNQKKLQRTTDIRDIRRLRSMTDERERGSKKMPCCSCRVDNSPGVQIWVNGPSCRAQKQQLLKLFSRRGSQLMRTDSAVARSAIFRPNGNTSSTGAPHGVSNGVDEGQWKFPENCQNFRVDIMECWSATSIPHPEIVSASVDLRNSLFYVCPGICILARSIIVVWFFSGNPNFFAESIDLVRLLTGTIYRTSSENPLGRKDFPKIRSWK
jgi:hypothetical protein